MWTKECRGMQPAARIWRAGGSGARTLPWGSPSLPGSGHATCLVESAVCRIMFWGQEGNGGARTIALRGSVMSMLRHGSFQWSAANASQRCMATLTMMMSAALIVNTSG